MEYSNSSVPEIIEKVKELPVGRSIALPLQTTDYLEAIKLADKLNATYSDARFEALRYTPKMKLGVKKLY